MPRGGGDVTRGIIRGKPRWSRGGSQGGQGEGAKGGKGELSEGGTAVYQKGQC